MKHRKILGLTDYRHRARMLTHYQGLVRVVIGKKNRYTYGGLYRTLDPHAPDLCLYYSDTRHDRGTRLETQGALGARLKAQIPPGTRYVLDKGRRKSLRVDPVWDRIQSP